MCETIHENYRKNPYTHGMQRTAGKHSQAQCGCFHTNPNAESGSHYHVASKSQFENYSLCLILVVFGKTCILAPNYIKIAH